MFAKRGTGPTAVAAIMLMLASACSTPSGHSTPSDREIQRALDKYSPRGESTTDTVRTITRPLDVSRYAQNPCQLMSSQQWSSLRLPPSPHLDTGNDADCDSYNRASVTELRFGIDNTRPFEAIFPWHRDAATPAAERETTVGGYPATIDPAAGEWCEVRFWVNRHADIDVNYSNVEHHPPFPNGCAGAQRAAELIVARMAELHVPPDRGRPDLVGPQLSVDRLNDHPCSGFTPAQLHALGMFTTDDTLSADDKVLAEKYSSCQIEFDHLSTDLNDRYSPGFETLEDLAYDHEQSPDKSPQWKVQHIDGIPVVTTERESDSCSVVVGSGTTATIDVDFSSPTDKSAPYHSDPCGGALKAAESLIHNLKK